MELKAKYKNINLYHPWLHKQENSGPLGGGDRLQWAKWEHVVCNSLVQINCPPLRLWAGMAADRAESCMAEAGAYPWNLLPA